MGTRAGTSLRVVGWALVAAGLLVTLYLVYSLFFTNIGTRAAQDRLRQDWDAAVAAAAPRPTPTGPATPAVVPTGDAIPQADGAGADGAGADGPDADGPDADGGEADERPETSDDPVMAVDLPDAPSGEAVALLWFERPGESPPVTAEPYVVVAGVTPADLAKGPGHYPETEGPGGDGNFAVAGHRTTHGAPFFNLDDLREGDEIHVMDRDGRQHVYRFADQRIVAPTSLGVLGADPLGTDVPTITLTTCHPRFSNRQRLIVFGELVA